MEEEEGGRDYNDVAQGSASQIPRLGYQYCLCTYYYDSV